MQILPKSLGTRPRLAVEIRSGGVVAARAEQVSATSPAHISAVSRAELAPDVLEPGLKPGNFRVRTSVVAAVRRTLEAVFEKGMGREVTLVLPDAAVRVLLLDFDALPGKVAEALPVVRFRLKKMLPFDADDAQVSYQTMTPARRSASKGLVRVVAVAIPRAVLDEYEAVIRDAGFEPGAILPSTLAALAGLDLEERPWLVVNAGPQSVTTAIVEDGVLLLHRSVDMSGNVQVGLLAEATSLQPEAPVVLPLVDVESTEQEWAMQEAAPQFGRNPYAEHPEFDNPSQDLAAVIAAEAIAGLELEASIMASTEIIAARAHAREITQAISVAAAYFEDTLQQSPSVILSAGSTGADALREMLAESDFGVVSAGLDVQAPGSTVKVQDIVPAEALIAQAATARVPRCWLAGVRGALRS